VKREKKEKLNSLLYRFNYAKKEALKLKKESEILYSAMSEVGDYLWHEIEHILPSDADSPVDLDALEKKIREFIGWLEAAAWPGYCIIETSTEIRDDLGKALDIIEKLKEEK